MRVARGGESRSSRAPGRQRRRLRWRRVVLPLVVVGVVTFLYWQPLSRYAAAREQLAERKQEVAELTAAKAKLERRLARTTSAETLVREARRTGLVRPGEQLFIVKGIPAWRRTHAPDR